MRCFFLQKRRFCENERERKEYTCNEPCSNDGFIHLLCGGQFHAEDVNASEMTDALQSMEKDKTVGGESAVEADKSNISDESGQTVEQSGSTDSDARNTVETESSDADQEAKDQKENWDVLLKSDNTIAIRHYKGTSAEVIIPDTMKYNGQDYPVSEIRWNSFISNASIQKITISKNVKTIGENAFRECTNLEEVIFASDAELQTIKDDVFFGDTALKTISIPASVEEMILRLIPAQSAVRQRRNRS